MRHHNSKKNKIIPKYDRLYFELYECLFFLQYYLAVKD